MRLLSAAFAIAAIFGTSCIAHADDITFIVSIVGSGSIGTQSFTDKRITLIDTTTTEQYYEFGDFGPPGWTDDFDGPLVGTIEGIGTFSTTAFLVGDPFLNLEIGDPNSRLYIYSGLTPPITPENIGPVIGYGGINDACDPEEQFAPCPGYIETSDGNLYISSFDPNSGTGEEIFTVTPEPSSLILLGTGMIGAAGFARRKFFTK